MGLLLPVAGVYALLYGVIVGMFNIGVCIGNGEYVNGT
jgi:hypothetical protein